MNQGKIWLVVKPTIGLPLFLGGVTVIALAVHTAILTNTDWYPAYYSGKAKAKPVAEVPAVQQPMAVAPVAATTVAVAAPAKAAQETSRKP